MKNKASLRINCRFWVCSFILKMVFLFWESSLSIWIGLYYKLIVAFCFHLSLPRCSFHLKEKFLLHIQNSVFLSPIWWVRFQSPSKVFRNFFFLDSTFYFLIWRDFCGFFVCLFYWAVKIILHFTSQFSFTFQSRIFMLKTVTWIFSFKMC